MAEVDLRTLIKKYIHTVGQAEGVSFIPHEPDGLFSAEELAVLHDIEAELDAETRTEPASDGVYK